MLAAPSSGAAAASPPPLAAEVAAAGGGGSEETATDASGATREFTPRHAGLAKPDVSAVSVTSTRVTPSTKRLVLGTDYVCGVCGTMKTCEASGGALNFTPEFEAEFAGSIYAEAVVRRMEVAAAGLDIVGPGTWPVCGSCADACMQIPSLNNPTDSLAAGQPKRCIGAQAFTTVSDAAAACRSIKSAYLIKVSGFVERSRNPNSVVVRADPCLFVVSNGPVTGQRCEHCNRLNGAMRKARQRARQAAAQALTEMLVKPGSGSPLPASPSQQQQQQPQQLQQMTQQPQQLQQMQQMTPQQQQQLQMQMQMQMQQQAMMAQMMSSQQAAQQQPQQQGQPQQQQSMMQMFPAQMMSSGNGGFPGAQVVQMAMPTPWTGGATFHQTPQGMMMMQPACASNMPGMQMMQPCTPTAGNDQQQQQQMMPAMQYMSMQQPQQQQKQQQTQQAEQAETAAPNAGQSQPLLQLHERSKDKAGTLQVETSSVSSAGSDLALPAAKRARC